MTEKDAKQIAFEKLSKIDNVRIVNYEERKKIGFNPIYELWEIITEVSVNDKLFPITIYVYFSTYFPLDIPKIYVSIETFNKIKYIPHVDNRRLVCTFDTNFIRLNTEDPFGIVYECINRAKRILVAGLEKVNFDDFTNEFKAYWEETYENEANPKIILSLIDKLNKYDKLKLICLSSSLRSYSYVLHKSDSISNTFKRFLNDYGLKYKEVTVFYLHNFPGYQPPFIYTNRNIFDLINNGDGLQIQEFQLFIKKNEYPKLVVTKKEINGKDFIFGWFHSHLNTSRKGFRPGSITPLLAFNTFQSNDKVGRITTETFTDNRLQSRTSGEITSKKYSFAVAGVGSIGSNLLYFLNSFEKPKFCLIDDDYLKIENINRHLLGFTNINQYKTKAINEFLKTGNPLQEIYTKEQSITEVLTSDPDFINSCDYLFSCIGNFTIERWMFNNLRNNVLKIPVFFIWVEPYLVGGHCLYIHPHDLKFENYFENGLFVNNIIPNTVYDKAGHLFTMREAGCQTTFVPYSGNNVISFLSHLFPRISSIIENKNQISTSFSWIGNLEKLDEIGVAKSKFANDIGTERIIQITL